MKRRSNEFSPSSWRNSLALRIARADWLAKVCSTSHVSSAKERGLRAAHHQHPDDVLVTEHRHGDDRPPAVVEERLEVLVELRGAHVLDLDGTALDRSTADEGAFERHLDVAQRLEHLRLRAVDGPGDEPSPVLVVLEDRSALGAGQVHRVPDDGRQHVVEVEGRAHRLADVAQGLELRHLPGERLAPVLQRVHQIEVAHGDGGLGREAW